MTGGQGGSGGRVVIWNLAPVLSEEDDNSSTPKMLCQMDNHLGISVGNISRTEHVLK